jgi:hypothetical protein
MRIIVLRFFSQMVVLRFVSQRLVTPFTPFVMADAFLASEVDRYGLRALNPRAVDLSQSDLAAVGPNPVVFVQVDQLDGFCRDVLPKIVGPFTLITGKWHLPALQRSEWVTTILGSPHLDRWYSQNQVFEDLPILPFPYGVNLSSAPHVFWRMRLRRVLGLGRSGVFVPHFAIHEHLDGVGLEARRQLEGVMGPRLKLSTYSQQNFAPQVRDLSTWRPTGHLSTLGECCFGRDTGEHYSSNFPISFRKRNGTC